MSSEVDVDCTSYCRLVQHGNVLTKSLTKREISEEKLISFLVKKCSGFVKNLDENGRSALHVACSNSKPLVAEVLLKLGANIHQKDTESAWTPLHRAIHYACLEIVVILKRFGASFDVLDSDFFTPLQLIPQITNQKTEFSLLVWGKNKNYNLGLGNVTTKNHPEAIKGLPMIVKASVNKFHSLFLTSSGALWGCGHSKEGRLGIGSEITVTSPQEIQVKFCHRNEKIVEVSAGMSHSLILTNKAVYGAGSNKHLQLGMKNVDLTLVFKEVPLDRADIDIKNMLNVVATDYHSMFVSKNGIFVCGLNVGQFSGIQESIAVPRRLPYPALPNQEVVWASTNNACICVYLNDKKAHYLHIFCNRKMKTYKNPLNERLKQCAISGGEMLYNSDEVVKNSSQKPLTITIITEHRNIYIWYEDIMQFVKVHLSSLFTTQITSIASCNEELLILANSHLFQASIQHKVQKLYQIESEYQEYSSKRDIAQFVCSKMTVRRIQHLSNVRQFYTDPDGESFIAVLAHAGIPVKDPERAEYDFSELLDEFLFTGSGIHDVTFEVGGESFKANRFVVGSRCGFLRKLLKNTGKDGICEIFEVRLTPGMFECILKWIYGNNLTEVDLQVVFGGRGDEETVKKLSLDFFKIAEEWDLTGICNILHNSKPFSKYIPKPEVTKLQLFKWFSMDSLPEFYDVTILLDENQKLRAHKVILMMRIEYFKMMFAHSWSEDAVVDLRRVSINFMRPILQFAYTNDIEALKTAGYSDNFMYNMCAILDQFLIEDVKNIFETMIMRKVNLRNCAENLDFSITYNCYLLKNFCMEFICLNLSRILESNVLDSLDPEILRELSEFYRKYFNFETDSSHVITPAFDAPTDEEIEEAVQGFDLTSYTELMQQALKKPQKIKNKLSKSEQLKRNYEKEGLKSLRGDEKDILDTPTTPKTPEINNNNPPESDDKTWHKKRERKDSGMRKSLTAAKCNEILKSETPQADQMVDLKTLKNSPSPPETTRNSFTLADFVTPKKTKTPVTPVKIDLEPKPAWNMDNLELKPLQNTPDPFKITSNKKKVATPSPKPSSAEKNFSSIIRDERKDKSNYEKIMSKSLILTQIEEKAIQELSEFYNIENIFDENISISRKVHKTSQNLSQWQYSNGA